MLRRSLRRLFDPHNLYRGDDCCGTCIQIGEYVVPYRMLWFRQSSRWCNLCALILLAVDPHMVAAKARDSDASCSIYKSDIGHLIFEIKWTDAGRPQSFKSAIFADKGGTGLTHMYLL
jgi:hypothetical protein